jgi:hypothetical protein
MSVLPCLRPPLLSRCRVSIAIRGRQRAPGQISPVPLSVPFQPQIGSRPVARPPPQRRPVYAVVIALR